MGARLELAVRGRGISEWMPRHHHRAHLTCLDERPHVLAHGRDDRGLLAEGPGPQRGRDDRGPLAQQHAEVEFCASAALHPDDHEPATRGEHRDVAGQVLGPHVVEDDVGARSVRRGHHPVDEVLLAVVDEHLGAEVGAGRQLLR